MVTQVLVPSDGSDCAARGVERALERFPDAQVTVLRVVAPVDAAGIQASDAPLKVETDADTDTPGGAVARCIPSDREVDVRTVVEPGVPASTIVEYARANDVDAIVMGSNDRSSLDRLLLGTVSGTVAKNAPVPVELVTA
jgi:nucleotide-binding universal stress UspA family protein